MNVGQSVNFAYTGGIQIFVVPNTGLYKLEAWGARGGAGVLWSGGRVAGTNGVYTCGYAFLKKGTTVYVGVGGAGGDGSTLYDVTVTAAGGYNGGGAWSGKPNTGSSSVGGGGGATHFALVGGVYTSIGYASFVTDKKGLVFAGGGSGSRRRVSYPPPDYTAVTKDDIGYGANGATLNGLNNWTQGAISYKGTTYSPSTTAGSNNGHGKATVTFMAKSFPTVYLGETQLDGAFVGESELDNIMLGENEIS